MAAPGHVGDRIRLITRQPLTLNTVRLYSSYHQHQDINSKRRNGPHLTSPTLRPTPHNPNLILKRSFSAISTIESALTTTQHLFSSIHATTGIPWFLTIPLIALTINLVTRLPITIYTHRLAQRRAELAPVLQAWYGRHARDVSRERHVLQRGQDAAKKETEKRFKRTTSRLFRAYRVQRWKDYLNLGILPIWVFNLEALRRLSGGKPGMLGALMYGNQTNADDTPATTTAALTGGLEEQRVVDISATGGHDVIGEAVVTAAADPTLATGGCLWFPDLMVADPLHILPGILSVLLALNTIPNTRAGLRAFLGLDNTQSTTVVQSQGRLRLLRALVIMCLAVGPLTMQLPAAIHLYWVSSTTISMIMKKAADWFIPIPKANNKLTPCKGQKIIFMLPKREKTKAP
ncbi:hypothetical protein B0H66DRAFT_536248 [Apodospora peruviana]|uniref:Mitochondrial inner membrane protein COX18 n=1 Tax=Apodospora peruviana TaxID=516989 RepID=A0AAE0M2B3_9PEZI|nr:hypothetical protein B0H66DRAFT_536248 [Apodospora peruviana]